MKPCIVMDSSFLLAAIDGNDTLHTDAAFLFSKIIERKDDIRILIPPLILYEVIVTLRRKGLSPKKVEAVLMRLVNLNYISVLTLSEFSAFKHATSMLNSHDQAQALRTNDFLIVCVAEEFAAQVLTFDYKLWQKCKPIYSETYLCAVIKNSDDETFDFLLELDHRLGKDTTLADYIPF